MADAYVLHEGAFGRVAMMKIRSGLVSHAHSEAHIVWWLGGSPAEARVGEEIVRYSEAQASGINAFEPHDLVLLDPSTPAMSLAFYISKDWLDQQRRMTGQPFVFTSPRIPIGPELRRAAWRAVHMLMERSDSKQDIDQAIGSLITAAVDASSHHAAAEALHMGPSIDFRLRKAIDFMREHVGDRIGVDEVATQVGLSRAHFFALFRGQLHTTPQIFWNAIRLEEAISMLVVNEEPLTSVALDLGFSAPGNFSRFFKDHTGASPSEYRRAAGDAWRQPVTGLPR